MPTEPMEASPPRLSRHLREALAAGAGERGITVEDLFQRVRVKGFGILLLMLSLPSALPVPAPGYSIPFGLALFLLGLQMLRGEMVPRLPERVTRARIGPKVARHMLRGGGWLFGMVERVVRPRWHWLQGRQVVRLPALLVLAMAILMMIPIPGTNTLPAIVIFLIGASLTERDGVLLLLAMVAGVMSAALYLVALSFLLLFFQEYGWEAVNHFLEMIKEFLRGFFA